jgi:hypothetical protein
MKAFTGLPPIDRNGFDLAAEMGSTFGARILGMYSIASHAFVGTETTYAVNGGVVNTKLVTPTKSNIRPQVGPYMAAVADLSDYHRDTSRKAYMGYPCFVPISAVMPSYRWISAPGFMDLVITPGALIYGLQYSMAPAISNALPNPPTLAVPAATLTWDCTVPFSNAPAFQFFDFNWVGLFQLSKPTLEPAFISVTTQPTGLVASVLAGQQPILNTITYDTIRITRLPGNLVAGDYVFGFNIIDRKGNAGVSVTLTLTVV